MRLFTSNLNLPILSSNLIRFEKFFINGLSDFILMSSSNAVMNFYSVRINGLVFYSPCFGSRTVLSEFFTTAGGLFFTASQLGVARSCTTKVTFFPTTAHSITLTLFGVGFKCWRSRRFPFIFFDIGRSHYTLVPIPDFVYFSVRRRKNIRIASKKLQTLKTFSNLLVSLRPPDPYKGKGFRVRGVTYRFKRGKKR